jgi:glyoxylase-like metal-dependent hydrolase (beta-lactamase superfamily II)
MFTVPPFQENTYVCHDAGAAAVIDPGASNESQREEILEYISARDLTVEHLMLTHAHIDHILSCKFFAERFEQSFKMHAADVPLLENAQEQGRLFNVPIEQPPPPGDLLAQGDTITLGRSRWKILHCPGHSPGSICFYDREHAFVISGDTVFEGSIGRTDLWQGSTEQLLQSIEEKLLVLDDSVVLYPGHGSQTTIGRERQSNPFLQELTD